jgi:HAE1 family hydrophobic/amphiphilic exporter-1
MHTARGRAYFALDAQRTHNMAPDAAIYQACLGRLRPIMTTTMAALMGTLPIALGFGFGADAEARRPLGLAVEGGPAVFQLPTLYITPVFYLYMERARGLADSRRKRQVGQAPSPAGVAAHTR